MVTRKYTSDYRLENSVDPKSGRLVTRPVYRGDWYGFLEPPETVARTRKTYLVCTGAAALAFLAALSLNAPATRVLYVLLPFALLLFPVYYAAAGCRRLVTAGERMTREHRDKIYDRLCSATLFLMIFSGASALGHAVMWALRGESVRDAIFLALTLVIFAAGLVMFRARRLLRLEKTGTAREDEA